MELFLNAYGIMGHKREHIVIHISVIITGERSQSKTFMCVEKQSYAGPVYAGIKILGCSEVLLCWHLLRFLQFKVI